MHVLRYPYNLNAPLSLLRSQAINPGRNDKVHWPGNWTATTMDGKRSARLEETLLSVLFIFVARDLRNLLL